jgi:hypothetical protein
MPPDRVRGSLLRPTIGRLMGLTVVLSLYFLFLRGALGGSAAAGRPLSAGQAWRGVSTSLAGFGALLILVGCVARAVLTRRGRPVGVWYATIATPGVFLLMSLPFLLERVAWLVGMGRPNGTALQHTGAGALSVLGSAVWLWLQWPRRCPACGCRSVIRVDRDPKSRPPGAPLPTWCASCGVEFVHDRRPLTWRAREPIPGPAEEATA